MKYPYLVLVFAGFLLLCAASACHSPPREIEPSLYPAVREPEEDEVSEEAFPEDFPPNREELFPSDPDLAVSSFDEVWAYLVEGREGALVRGLPLSDIGYFSADVDSYGKLGNIPSRKKIPPFPARLHLVATCGSYALTHFVLLEGSRERRELVADLIAATKDFDGLQIDFEYVLFRDGDAFRSFLAELRAGLGEKMLTVAFKARTGTVANDPYDYKKVKPLVDRILIMAYDEHWSTSAPGPVASMEWCRRVARYALSVIGPEKVIMGLPFYGRAWGHINPSRALVYSGVEDLINEYQMENIGREDGIPTFEYEVPVKVKVYYDDERSLSERMEMYRSLGIRSAGFWRLGQETPAIWSRLRLEPASRAP
jgi:spore germination protein YaaH